MAFVYSSVVEAKVTAHALWMITARPPVVGVVRGVFRLTGHRSVE